MRGLLASPLLTVQGRIALLGRFVFALLMVPGLAGAAEYHTHFAVADEAARSQGAPWIEDYRAAVRSFETSEDTYPAIAEFNYLALDGSMAAAIRLCAIYAYGVESEVNPIAGLFWCGKAYEAGYSAAGGIRRDLFLTYWPHYEG